MVRNYKRKSGRAPWDLQKMAAAAAAIRNGELSIREASSVYGIPKSTLERHKNQKVQVPGCLGRFQPTLPLDMERELVDYCTHMQNRLFGFTITDGFQPCRTQWTHVTYLMERKCLLERTGCKAFSREVLNQVYELQNQQVLVEQ